MPARDPAVLQKLKSYLTATLAQEMELRPLEGEPHPAAWQRLERICLDD
jgi:hypothetical protein